MKAFAPKLSVNLFNSSNGIEGISIGNTFCGALFAIPLGSPLALPVFTHGYCKSLSITLQRKETYCIKKRITNMKMLPPPPPYVLPLGGAVYWLAGGPLLSSSAPPQHNILQLVLSAPLNKPYSQKRSMFNQSPETIFNAQILHRQCGNKIKSNRNHFFVHPLPKSQERVFDRGDEHDQ